jgi:(p)ppGpp synthase/HD superfamily hydrolase
MSMIIIQAMDIALRAHDGQKRKYTQEPYIVHPFAVAGLVASTGADDYSIAAALLHDVVEDCGVDPCYLAATFGSRVTDLVMAVTDVSKPTDGNRAVRKRLDLEHLALASPQAQTIKLADLIDNTKTIIAFDPAFAQTYLEEKRALLEVLKRGHVGLWSIARTLAR